MHHAGDNQNRIKLAMVTAFPATPGLINGGVESVAYNLIDSFCRIGTIEVHVLAPIREQALVIEQRNNITIHWIPISRLPGVLGYWSTFRKAIHRRLDEIQPHITHFQDVAGWTLSYDKPYVLTIHGIAERDTLFSYRSFRKCRSLLIGAIEKRGRENSPNTIIINPYVTEQLKDQIKGHAWHIENPISPEFFDIKREPFKPLILYVGRIIKRKNVDGLLRAFRKVHIQIPEAILHIAGSEDRATLQKCTDYVKECGLEHAVHFLGNISRATLSRELAQAACLALVSHQETAPMVIAEAMAASVPIIASCITGIPYMIEEGRTGFGVNQNDADDIATKLITLLSDKNRNQAMGRHCQEVARRRFHADVVAAQTLKVYEHILGRSA
jgi:glycosyltransferase involved in cell wall biosynthesis